MNKGVAKISKDFLKGRNEIFKCLTVHVLNWRKCKPLLHMEFWRSLPCCLRDWSTWYICLTLYDSMRLINPMYFCSKSVTNLTIKLKQRFSFPLISSLFSYYFNWKPDILILFPTQSAQEITSLETTCTFSNILEHMTVLNLVI